LTLPPGETAGFRLEVTMTKGSCLCGKVRFEVDGAFKEAHHCHCSQCRKAHGAAFATYACARTKDLRIVAGEPEIAHFRSSVPVRRSFCVGCGSRLFFQHDAAPHLTFVAAGALDDAAAGALPIDAHVFVGSKAGWWTLHDDLARHQGQRPEYGG
jgi:hypothetical protein